MSRTSRYVCPRCGSPDVQSPHWVELNTDTILGEYTTQENWCPDCGVHSPSVCLVDVETGHCAYCDEVHIFAPTVEGHPCST